jgi:NAD kinase
MKKVIVVGDKKEELIPDLKKHGFILAKENFDDIDFVISYGGDGTLIKSEHDYPGIPKIPLRASRICKKCSNRSNEDVLSTIQKENFKIEKLIKLEAIFKNNSTEALNEIAIKNANQRYAIRYELAIDDKWIEHEIIGDGIVAATPFGSTGYYRSITRSFIYDGIGLAINNSTEQYDHVVLKDNMSIRVKISRGPAYVFADNKEGFMELNDGDEIFIKKSENVAFLVIPEFSS